MNLPFAFCNLNNTSCVLVQQHLCGCWIIIVFGNHPDPKLWTLLCHYDDFFFVFRSNNYNSWARPSLLNVFDLPRMSRTSSEEYLEGEYAQNNGRWGHIYYQRKFIIKGCLNIKGKSNISALLLQRQVGLNITKKRQDGWIKDTPV